MQDLLSDSQLDKLSDILIAVGQVLFGSIVVPFFFGLDKTQPAMLLSGLILMLGSWILGVLIVKKKGSK